MRFFFFLLAALTLLPGAARAAANHFDFYGFNFPTWQDNEYSQADAKASMTQLLGTGANAVAFTPTWYMASVMASKIDNTSRTATKESLQKIIQAAHGRKIIFKPHIDLPDGVDAWRAQIKPASVDEWFKSYDAMIVDYVRWIVRNNIHVDLFVIGTELTSMSPYTSKWLELIKMIKDAKYSGRLTFAATSDDYKNVKFWDSLDYVGVDAYFPLNDGADLNSLKKSWSSRAKELSSLGKPVLFTEVGVASCKGAQVKPWIFKCDTVVDTQLQKDYLEAFLDVFSGKDYFKGFLLWSWDTNPDAGKSGDSVSGMTVQNKPALEVLKKFFQSQTGPQATDPHASLRFKQLNLQSPDWN